MIRIQDLKIRNLLDYHSQTVIVLEIKREGVEFGYFKDSIGFLRKWNDCDFPKPISLTEEWLLKFGWVWNEDCDSYEKYPNGDARMNLKFQPVNCSYEMFNYVIKALICKRLFYVHQLQNLYFALTDKELKYET